jgi:hypothetical protein
MRLNGTGLESMMVSDLQVVLLVFSEGAEHHKSKVLRKVSSEDENDGKSRGQSEAALNIEEKREAASTQIKQEERFSQRFAS